jgi:Tfp pilus assembly protein PilN
VRPVNLLPDGDRARAPISVSENAHKVVLGVLAGLLVAMLAYVLTTNQITSHKSDIDKANQEQQAAQKRVDKLGPFGRFAQIKATRVKSVSDLAKTRFDWERLMRELALVLPSGVWLTEVDASSSGAPQAGTGSSSPPPADSSTTSSGATPTVVISGCAKTQSTVATAMVRMRSLHRAENVELSESGNGKSDGGSGGEPTAGGEGCGSRYAFKTTVTFSADAKADTAPKKHDGVPASLGGGS